jgi:hypothetical protein
MHTTHRFAATALLIFVSLLAPSMARANTYTVEGCGTQGPGALQFSSNPPSAFSLFDDLCNASSSPTFTSVNYQTSATYTQGDQASWGFQAPAGESVSGLGIVGGDYTDSDGWLSGWAVNGDPDQNALPADDDCLTYSSSPCAAFDAGWFPVSGASGVDLVMFCDAQAVPSVTCSVQSEFSNSVAAFDDAVVQIQDPGDAAPQVSGSLWSAGQGLGLSGGWISGINAGADLSLNFKATDPGGVCTLEAALTDGDGNVVVSSSPVEQTPTTDPSSAVAIADGVPAPFASTEPCGATDTGVMSFAPNLSALPTGTYHLNVVSQNPGEYQDGTYTFAQGDALAGGLAIKVDNSIPTVTISPSDPGPAGGGAPESWSATPESVTVAATDSAGSSGLAQITCTTPSGTTSYPVSGDHASVVLSISAPGSGSISCDASSIAGNTSAAASTQYAVDAQVPSVLFTGAAAAPAWNSGGQTVTVTGVETTQASGIASVSCQLDGGAWSSTTGSVAHVSVTGDGKHQLSCLTTTAAGVDSSATSESIQIDSDLPTLDLSGGPSQSSWHTAGQTITATASAAGGDQISAITCTLAGAALTYPNTGGSSTESVVISVAAPGGDLDCEARDSAGNVSATQSWSFLIDDTPPAGYFLAGNTTDPTKTEVSLSDTGSGVAGAKIQIETDGAWRSLPTSLHSAGTVATAQIPDGGSLSDGIHALRASVWDRAGNRAYITQNAIGVAESVTLPLRELTELTAVLSAGRVHVAATASVEKRPLSVKYGQRVRLAGRLVTVTGVSVAHATVVVAERLAGGRAIRTLTKIRTNSRGRFSATLLPGPSRTLVVTYDGSGSLRSASAAAATRVAGRVGLAVPPVGTAGRRVTLRGRVLGGHVPHPGLLVQLWYAAPGGQGGWQPFEHAVRADAAGRWSLTFPLSSAIRGHDYLFRAIVPAQGNWPYAGAVSSPAPLKVV